MIAIAPFTYIYSIFVKDFKISLGSETGILVLDANNYKVIYQYITFSKVNFIAHMGNWIYYISNNSIYKIGFNWNFHQSPYLVKSNIEIPKRFGITDDYKLVLDYESYRKVLNDAGFEEDTFYSNVYWSSHSLNFSQNGIYNVKKGFVNFTKSFEYLDYNLVGSEGLGLRIYYKNSLTLKDSISIGTFNKIFKSFTIRENKLYILGEKGIDVLDSEFNQVNFIKIDICTDIARIIDRFVFCKNNIYRIDEDDEVFKTMKAIDFQKIRFLKNKFYIVSIDGVYEFDDGFTRLYDGRVYDIYLKDDSLAYIKQPSDWYISVVDSFLCSRYGIRSLNNSEVAYSFSLGNVNDCLIYGNFIYIASNSGVYRFSMKEKRFYTYSNVKDIKEILVFNNKLLALSKNLIYILPLNF
ncbi:MAG: hypothetical protein N2504_02375 [candidate division WOR-3 bacterium]|nr:hypothetical protein [candidate division WOR-3 bacterium]MCX7947420.1 hypothetical protein [candidate division WOR-3 bacterium]MDW8151182.1 hypothetical protein [candidate division WOR-3 bacterium]